jgi:hypothetical protein
MQPTPIAPNIFNPDGSLTAEEEARRSAAQNAMMGAAGERTEDIYEIDYFGVDERREVYLPGSKTQYVVIKEFTEGDRKKYLDKVNKDVRFGKDNTATMKTSPGSDRHELLKIAIVDFKLQRGTGDNVVIMTIVTHPRVLEEFLEKTSPKVIDHIVKEVHKLNPWLINDASVEDMEKELADLQEMIDLKKAEEAKNDSSASK